MPKSVVNDFTTKIATANGTGSQSANNILFKTLVRMGIPTSAKNLFPSNIQGLPTWFHIRTSPQGYQSMRRKSEILVAVNPASFTSDHAAVESGNVVIYDSARISIPQEKKGVSYYPVPLSTIAKTNFDNPRIRTLLTNTVYVGVLAELFNLDTQIIEQVIRDTFKKKQKVVDVNIKAVTLGIDYAKENLKKTDSYTYNKSDQTPNKIVMEGNAATALGCIFGGCTVAAWYPITPARRLSESVETEGKGFRSGPKTKTSKIAVVQAEDELSAVGMAIGAGWAGSRAMTGTSGPGISLMSEFIGLAYYAEVPVVIFDVQRVGPSTGLPTRTQQGDIQLCASASHGDTQHILLLPATIKECFELSARAFDVADRMQTPVFVLTDLELGMNLWASDPFEYYDKPFDRGKVLGVEAMAKAKKFERYLDSDKDGIGYRTLPGTPHPLAAYFTRGTGHTEQATYSEEPDVYERNMKRLAKKFETTTQYTPKPLFTGDKNAKLGIISYGTTHHAIIEAQDLLRVGKKSAKCLRLLSYPFHDEVKQFIDSCDHVAVVEANRDAQMAGLLTQAYPGSDRKIKKVAFSDGFPMDPVRITDTILEVI